MAQTKRPSSYEAKRPLWAIDYPRVVIKSALSLVAEYLLLRFMMSFQNIPKHFYLFIFQNLCQALRPAERKKPASLLARGGRPEGSTNALSKEVGRHPTLRKSKPRGKRMPCANDNLSRPTPSILLIVPFFFQRQID